MRRKLSDSELRSLRHPKEDSRFFLALVICVPMALAIFFLAFLSWEIFLIVLVAAALLLWLVHAMAKAHLVANSVRVSEKNFSEIFRVVEEVKYVLDYKKEVEVFIVEDGNVNAFLANFFRINYIILNSELVEDMLNGKSILQMKWVIARFVGALKAKHLRLDIFKLVLESIENIKIFNLFILPYERATQFSGDNIGLAVCGDFGEVMHAFDKFLVGNQLAKRVNLAGVLEQGRETKKSFLAFFLRLFATHPHVIDRYLNLLAFAKKYMRAQYNAYIANLGFNSQQDLRETLPDHYTNNPPVHISVAERRNTTTIQVKPSSGNGPTVRDSIKISKR